ncbi:MAG: GIY-YIG nuclease family protein [Deltaproteobacteria bacterium]|nr:GIY-YIG nuclease family protein [Deltaproteobacteria bacterium]
MIRCHDGALYTGISNDVPLRFEKHREMGKQGAKYLRGRGPLKLVFQKKIGGKSAALKMEQKIKKLSKSQKEIIVQKGDIDQNL